MKQPDQQETTAAEQTIPVSGDSGPAESTPPDARVEAAFEKAVPMEQEGEQQPFVGQQAMRQMYTPHVADAQPMSDNLFELMPPNQLKDSFAWSSSKESTLFGIAIRDMDEPSLRIAAGWLMQHYSTAMAKLGEIAAVKQELESIVQKQEMDSVALREQLTKTQSDLGHSQATQQVVRQDMGG